MRLIPQSAPQKIYQPNDGVTVVEVLNLSVKKKESRAAVLIASAIHMPLVLPFFEPSRSKPGNVPAIRPTNRLMITTALSERSFAITPARPTKPIAQPMPIGMNIFQYSLRFLNGCASTAIIWR